MAWPQSPLTLLLFLWSTMMIMISTTVASELVFLQLSRSLSPNHSDIHHLLKSTSSRSAARFRRHTTKRHVSLPLSPGSDYTLTLTIPTSPPQTVSLYMDTGSDLVWFPCHPFQCIMCEGKTPAPPPLPPRLPPPTVSCASPACAAAHSSPSTSDLCAAARCPLDSIETSDCAAAFRCPAFYYAYADGSLVGDLHRHTLVASSSLPLPNFTFACAHSALAEPVGVAGFGRGLLSMPAQLSPHLGHHFSYCLVSHSFNAARSRRPSPLILGRYDGGLSKPDPFVYTPMLDNPKHPYFYSVGLLGVSVGKRNVPAPEFLRQVDMKGFGGMVVDSGTTFTILPGRFYDAVVEEFDRRVVSERATEIEEATGLRPCYYGEESGGAIAVPALTLHFAGKESSVALPRRNYFYEFREGGKGKGKGKRKAGCLMMMNGGEEEEAEGGPGATLGNYQQQGFEVSYDLENGRVGFAKRKCSALWHDLNGLR